MKFNLSICLLSSARGRAPSRFKLMLRRDSSQGFDAAFARKRGAATGSGFGGTFLAAIVAQDDIVWGGTSGSKYAVCGVLKSHRESVQRGNAARNA